MVPRRTSSLWPCVSANELTFGPRRPSLSHSSCVPFPTVGLGWLLLQAPEIIDMYQIPCSVYDLRTKVREQFEKNKHVTDVRVIDVLILKGRQEFQESINYWKTPVRHLR